MSARMMKKVLKEQEAALQQQQQQLISDDDSESPESPPPARNYFDLLEDEDGHSCDDQENDEVAIESSDCAISNKHSSKGKDVNTVPKTSVKSKKKKKNKKKKVEAIIENNVESSDLMLESLSLGASSSGHQLGASNGTMKKKQCNHSLLQVDPKFLSAENELRRIFGNSVVKTHVRSNLPANSSRLVRGGRRVGQNLKKTILVSPSHDWHRWDGSFSMELLETRDGVDYFKYVHSSSYTQAQGAFEAVKASNDPNGIRNILATHPYHIDSLTTLAEYFKFMGEQQMSGDFTARCLYAMECAWHPHFSTSGNCQLKYVHDTNKPFFSSLFTHMKNMDRRGCHRAALEICKFLLSLDSDDPLGAMFCIDYYALRAEEYAWLERFAEEYKCDNSLWLYPNISFSFAVCRLYLERDEHADATSGKSHSSDLMKQALMLHPSVLKKLVAKVPLKERKWTDVLKHSFFGSEKTGSPSLDHLIAIYVERSYLIWRLPELQKFLYDSALLVIEMLDKQANVVKDWACVRKEAFSTEKNEYSHLLVSDFSDSVPTIPPEFMVDQMGGMGQLEQVPNLPEDHMIRDVANRSPLAVLFESMLPWMNYGTGDGEHIQPEQANED